jgi:Scavenger mRNA decapping enzyme (DcpS) N-terminal
MLGWLSHSEDRPDVKINVIYPATDVHIRKVIPRSFNDYNQKRSPLTIPLLFV